MMKCRDPSTRIRVTPGKAAYSRVHIASATAAGAPLKILGIACSPRRGMTTAKAVQAALDNLRRGRTTLVIAHRLSTVVDAHEIIVLEHGTVVERGRHTELLAAGGRYAQMWALQQSGGDGSGAADVSPAPATPVGGPHGHQMA